MRPLETRSPGLRDWALLVFRIVVGGLLALHGGQKLFMFGFGGTAEFLGEMGVPVPPLAAVAAIFVEFVLGLAILAGAFLPFAGLVVAVYMLGVLVIAHAQLNPFVADGGWELVALFAVAGLVLAVVGGGRYGVDAALAGRRREPVAAHA